MGTSGPATAERRRLNSDSAQAALSKWHRAVGVVAICVLAGLTSVGCSTPVMRMGKPPAVDRLSELTVGVSTAKDVVAVLGEPQGRGAARSPTFGLKESWLYESAEVEGTKARMRMLMVFLDKETGVYQGHMWMASGMLFGQTK